MVAVLTRNTDSGDILGYDLGDKKDKDQMIRVLAYEGVFLDPEDVDRLNQNWTDNTSKKEFKKLSREVANDLSDQFNAQATMSDRIVYATGHASLSLSPVDLERLGKEPYPDMYSEMEHIAREYMEKMDITDTQWVLTFHPGTRCPHMHLAYNRVRNDGTVISAKKERPRSMKACEEITAAHKLATGGEVERNLEALCDKRKVYAQMRLAALDARAESCTFDEFEANLRKKGILLTVTGQGLSYALESGEYYTKGSTLDRNALSYDKVETTLAQNLAARQAQEEAARQKAEAEAKAAQEAIRQEQRDVIADFRSTIFPVGEQIYGIRNSTYELCKEAIESEIGLSEATASAFKQLKKTWKENDKFNQQIAESKTRTDTFEAVCGILTCLNPIVGLTAMLLAGIAGDIHRASLAAQKKKLLVKVNSLRDELTALEAKKATLTIDKLARLKQYLDAKRMYKEYRDSLQTVDREVVAIESDIRVAEKTPPSAAKTYEIVQKFNSNGYPYRIKKEQDGLMKLQRLEADKNSPIVDGKHTGRRWYTKEKFSAYKEVGRDADGVYFTIKDTADNTRFINQNGIDLSTKKQQQLGLVSKGYGGPSR